MKTFFFLSLAICLFLSDYVKAQTPDSSLVRIETTDGNEYVGMLVREDQQKLVLNTNDLGEITIQKINIRTREIIREEQIKDGDVWFENPQATRYFLTPNGYGLKKGEGYYQNIYVFWNQFTVGVTDNVAIGGGIIPLFLFDGSPTPAFLSTKISIPLIKEKVNLAGGALVGAVLGEESATFGRCLRSFDSGPKRSKFYVWPWFYRYRRGVGKYAHYEYEWHGTLLKTNVLYYRKLLRAC